LVGSPFSAQRARRPALHGRARTVVAKRFIEFLDRLLYGATAPIFLIVDGHPVHRSAAVRWHVAGCKGRLRLFFLPPYARNSSRRAGLARSQVHGLGRTTVRTRSDFETKVSHTCIRCSADQQRCGPSFSQSIRVTLLECRQFNELIYKGTVPLCRPSTW